MKTTNLITNAFLIVGVFMPLASRVLAQQPSEREMRPTIRVTGEATVMARPDQAQIDIGVVTQAATARAAATQNAQQLDAVISQLRRMLGSSGDIKTSSYSLTPNYRYPKDGGTPTITGYTATNTVQVKVNDLNKVGDVIDVSMQTGANQIQRLQFTLKDEQAAQTQALREAAVKAKAQAEALASALGLKIVRVLSVTEQEPVVVRPLMQEAMSMRAEAPSAPTPVEPGTIDIHATVVLVVEIGP